MPRLADAGFHAVAPFARGYAPTAVPTDGTSTLGAWVADTLAFHDRFGHDRPGVIVGHDWGSLTTFGSAVFAPDRWRRVVTMSVPPTAVLAARLLDFEQVRAFWYQYVFQSPNAEAIVANDDLRFVAELWREWSPGFDATSELPHVKDALRNPANLTAALSTYRSLYDATLQPPEYAAELAAVFGQNPQPTLYLQGRDDGCVVVDLTDEIRAFLAEGSEADLIAGAGHFLQYEQPDAVNDRILAFLSA
jgi:pimeloyl-ACP methyl ester carboxylesterase